MHKALIIIKEALKRKRLKALLVTNIKNIRYLSGFTGSTALLLITQKRDFFITDFRYKEQSLREVRGFEIIIPKGKPLTVVKKILKGLDIKKIGFEVTAPYSLYASLKKELKPVPTEHLVEKAREIKEQGEIKLIKEAVFRAERAFQQIKPRIRKGVTERSIALRLEEAIKRLGSKRLPFDIIVASGENSALPHAGVTNRRLRAGDLVVIDWGAEADGYFSDMTRTFLLKGPDTEKKIKIYNIVLKANKRALKEAKPAMPAKELDARARDIIKEAGYGEFFGHGTGHGVGLDIHEAPRISFLSKDVLKEGMVFTIEPGIYLSGIGGVRIEDMVYLTSKGARVLTSLPKDLEILG
ncbi:MAG: aminopeptidase P family protein [Nitrospirae bacterium]|nr:aminopeptidase P family protein [Nitrospirota bacterium]